MRSGTPVAASKSTRQPSPCSERKRAHAGAPAAAGLSQRTWRSGRTAGPEATSSVAPRFTR
jgi:hypothetical protein